MDSMRIIPVTICCMTIALVEVSCGGSCECEKQPGCITLEARTENGDSLIESAMYCSASHLYLDNVVRDSVEAFTDRNHSSQVTRVDSITSTDQKDDLNWREAGRMQKQGWQCECDK